MHATDRIAEVIARVRPDTIVTFGPDGMTGHPDHRAVSAWTTAAWRVAGGPARLWYATLTPVVPRPLGAPQRPARDVGLHDRPPCTEPDELALVLELDGDLLDRKLAALRAHASQTDPLADLVGDATFRAWWSTEAFVDAGSLPVAPQLARATR